MDTLKVDVININELSGTTFWGISLDTLSSSLLSVLLALIVFSLGLYYSKKYDLNKRFQYLKQIENYIYAVFEDLKKSVKAKIKSFESLIEQLKEKKFRDFEVKYISDYSMDFINDLDWLDFFSVFTILKKKDGESNVNLYQNFNQNISSIRDVNSLWLDSYKELLRRQTEYERQWNEAITEIGKKVDNFAHWLRKENYKKGSNAFIDELDNIIGTHQRTDNARDIFVAINSLIIPLHKHIRKNQEQELGRGFLDHVMACKYAFANFVKNRQVFKTQFEEYNKKLKENIEDLGKNVNSLKKMTDNKPKFRQIWKI